MMKLKGKPGPCLVCGGKGEVVDLSFSCLSTVGDYMVDCTECDTTVRRLPPRK